MSDSGLIIIKIGGGLIAPKKLSEETADLESVKRVAGEIKQLVDSGVQVVVVNGSGNFGHSWATKYSTQDGFKVDDKEKRWGAARTQYSTGLINKIVVGELLNVGVAAGSVAPHDIWRIEGKRLKNLGLIRQLLAMKITPVLYGDVIWDSIKGCQIYSGETIIYKLVTELVRKGETVNKIIQLSVEQGVWDENKKIIPEIHSKNWSKYKKSIHGSFGVDVTGGMLHKVETSMRIAKRYGIISEISNTLGSNLKTTIKY